MNEKGKADMRYSPDADALIVRFSRKPVDHAEEAGDFIVHLAEDGEVVLIEILHAQEFLLEALQRALQGQGQGQGQRAAQAKAKTKPESKTPV